MYALVLEPDLMVVTPTTPSRATTSLDEPIHEVILEEEEGEEEPEVEEEQEVEEKPEVEEPEGEEEEEGEEEQEQEGREEEKVVEQFVCDVEEAVDLQEACREDETVHTVTETSIQSLESEGTLRVLLSKQFKAIDDSLAKCPLKSHRNRSVGKSWVL